MKPISDSLEALFEENYERVYRFALSMTSNPEFAKEVTQDAFYKAFLKLETLKDKTKFYSWVCSIAINEYKDMQRQVINYRNRNVSIYNQDGKLQDENIPELRVIEEPQGIYEGKEYIYEMMYCINKLRIEEQQILTFKYYYELSYATIGEILDISGDTAKVKAFRAKKKVIRMLHNIRSREVYEL